MEKSKSETTENNEEEIAAYVVEAVTGCITDTFTYGDSYKKLSKENRKKILEHLAKKDKCIVFNEGVGFVKLYDNILEELSKNLSNAEFTFTIRLAKHVSFNDCILRTNGNPKGKILDAKDIAALLQMDDSNVRRLISSLIKKGVLGRHVTGCKGSLSKKETAITCNPYIFTRGSEINCTTISLFANSRWNVSQEELRSEND